MLHSKNVKLKTKLWRSIVLNTETESRPIRFFNNGSCGDQSNCSKIPWKLSKKQRDQIRTRGKQTIFDPATWAEELSNFLVFILFWKNETAYLKNKNFLR